MDGGRDARLGAGRRTASPFRGSSVTDQSGIRAGESRGPVDSHAFPVGALIAGGRNTRYGATKALEPVRGRRLVDGVATALAEATDQVVLITNETALRDHVGFPARGDGVRGLGPLGGVLTALHWAAELERQGSSLSPATCRFPPPRFSEESRRSRRRVGQTPSFQRIRATGGGSSPSSRSIPAHASSRSRAQSAAATTAWSASLRRSASSACRWTRCVGMATPGVSSST